MPVRHSNLRPAVLALSASALALGLAACKVDSRPLLARGDGVAAVQPAGYAYGPEALGLPYAQPAPLMPVSDPYDGYALAERAYAYDRAAYRAPPDYAFRYGEAEPWAWQLADNSLMFAEPYRDDYRFYYYEPGETYPYFVRDDRYGYAYGDNGGLLAVLDATGALLPNSQLSALADVAGRYLYRGQSLRGVYYDTPRYAVAESVWIERAPVLYADQRPWIEVAEAQPAWREYRVSSGEQWLRAFEPERLRREAVARRFDDRIDWESAKAYRKAVKAERKFEREVAKEDRKFARDIAKDDRKFARDVAKEDRKAFREAAKDQRRFEREQARNAFEAARPASVVVRDRGDDGRRGEGFRGEDRRADRAARHDDGRREVARNDDRGRGSDDGKRSRGADDRGGGKPDHAKGHDNGGGKGHGDGGKGRGGKD